MDVHWVGSGFQELQKKTEKLSHQHSQIRRKLLALQKLDSTEKVLLEVLCNSFAYLFWGLIVLIKFMMKVITNHQRFISQSEKRLERASDNRESLLNERIAKAHKHNESAVKMEKVSF